MRGALVLLLLAFASLVGACKASSAPTRDGGASVRSATASSAGLETADGAAIYAQLCAVCHGANATGYAADNAPSLVNKTFLESATDDQLRRSIVEGRPGTSMAPYGAERGGPLNSDAVARVVSWIRIRGHGASHPIPRRLQGDATRGAPLYAANCQKCHGDVGQRGNAVHLANPRFLDASSDAFLGWAIAQGRPGTAMEAWEGKLTPAQIDDLVAFIRGFGAPAPVASLPPPTGKEPIVLNPRGQQAAFEPKDDRYVSIEQVKKALDEKRRIVLVDARPQSDWMRAHVTGAVSIPHHDLTRLPEVPADGTWVVAYCACPHHLSGEVVDALRKRGVTHAVILDEGFLEWHRRGYPVVAAPGVMPPPQPAAPGASLSPPVSNRSHVSDAGHGG